jgi:hypothetical protein
MVGGPAVQTQLAQDQQLRILAAALDSTHDPVSVDLQVQNGKTLDPYSFHCQDYSEHDWICYSVLISSNNSKET